MAERKLNWRQACVIMGCGKDKFYELIRMGKLPATRVGQRGLRVREADVLRLVEPIEPYSGRENQNTIENDKSFVG